MPDEYCLSCGRLLREDLAGSLLKLTGIAALDTKPNPTPMKYCSPACRGHAKDPRIQPLRLELARAFQKLLTSQPDGRAVLCSEAQGAVQEESTLGIRPSEQREEARRAARRLVNFGFPSQGLEEEKREVEAVQDGHRVEGSYAKGEWGIRWSDT